MIISLSRKSRIIQTQICPECLDNYSYHKRNNSFSKTKITKKTLDA